MKVLIVEDHRRLAQSIKKGLGQEKIISDISFNGKEGLDMIFSDGYDVVVLDLMLPGLNGIEICKKVRKEGIKTPILMLTARAELDDKVTGLNCGADDYLTKPFAFKELVARIRALARRPKQTTGNKIRVNDLVLDINISEVKRNGKVLKLSKREFSLLEYLMRHKGIVVNKSKIISQVWEHDADITDNAVEAFVSSLRKKVDKAFKKSKPLIHTVRGFGYRLGDR